MLFGNKDEFAVEVELNEDPGGHWLYGKFGYWIAGKRLGDYDLGASLSVVFLQWKWIVYDGGKRNGENLCGAHPEEVFNALDHSLFASEFPKSNLQVPDEPARFKIFEGMDIFDEWKAYLIECGDQARIIYRRDGDAGVTVVSLAKGIFDQAISEAYAYITALVEKEEASRPDWYLE